MGACEDCGDDDPDHLEFNHIDRLAKKGEVCKMTTIPKQKEERKGCNVKCKKCHLVYTYTVQLPPKRKDRGPKDMVRKAREFVNNYKISLGGCQNPHCKDKFDPNNLAFYEFHHEIFQDKLYAISRMVATGYSIKSIIKELKKCILLCAYCHKKETAADWVKRREYYTSLEKPLPKKKKWEPKFTMDDVKEIRKLYNEDKLTQESIAEKFNVSRAHIGRIVNNEHYIDESYQKTKSRWKFTKDDIKDIRRLYNEEDAKILDLAEEYNVGANSIRSILSNKNYHDPNYERTRFPKQLTDENIAEIRALYNNDNSSFSELAEQYEVSIPYIRDIVANRQRVNKDYVRTRFPQTSEVEEVEEVEADEVEEDELEAEPDEADEEAEVVAEVEKVVEVDESDQKESETNKYQVSILRQAYNSNRNFCLSKLADNYNFSILEMYEIMNNKLYIDDKYVRTRYGPYLSRGDVLDIRRLYNEGNLSYSDLSENYNISVEHIRNLIMNKRRVDNTYVRTRWDTMIKTPKKLTDQNVADIRDLYYNKKVEVRNIAIKYSVPMERVLEVISNIESMDVDECNSTNPPTIILGDAEVEEIRNLYNKGKSNISALAQKYGLTILHVKEIIANTKHVNKNYIQRKFQLKFTNDDVREMRHLYNREKYSFAELAKIYNTDVTYVADIIANKIWVNTNYVRTNFHVRLTDDDVSEIRKLFKHVSIDKLAQTYNISATNIKAIINDPRCADKEYGSVKPPPKKDQKELQVWGKTIVTYT